MKYKNLKTIPAFPYRKERERTQALTFLVAVLGFLSFWYSVVFVAAIPIIWVFAPSILEIQLIRLLIALCITVPITLSCGYIRAVLTKQEKQHDAKLREFIRQELA